MKKKRLLAAFFLALAASTVSASCFPIVLAPYVGADLQWRYTDFKKDFGKNVFKHNHAQANLYGGIQLTDYFSIEGGYQTTFHDDKNINFSQGTIILDVPASTNTNFTGIARFKGWHGSIVGYLPLSCVFPISFVGSIGFTTIKAKLTTYSNAPGFPVETLNFVKTKSVLRVGGGIRCFLTNCIGIRAMVFWEDTSKFQEIRPLIASNFPSIDEVAKLTGSVSAGLGLFFQF